MARKRALFWRLLLGMCGISQPMKYTHAASRCDPGPPLARASPPFRATWERPKCESAPCCHDREHTQGQAAPSGRPQLEREEEGMRRWDQCGQRAGETFVRLPTHPLFLGRRLALLTDLYLDLALPILTQEASPRPAPRPAPPTPLTSSSFDARQPEPARDQAAPCRLPSRARSRPAAAALALDLGEMVSSWHFTLSSGRIPLLSPPSLLTVDHVRELRADRGRPCLPMSSLSVHVVVVRSPPSRFSTFRHRRPPLSDFPSPPSHPVVLVAALSRRPNSLTPGLAT